MKIRGDVSKSDTININEIADYSISNKGLNYGLDIKKIFWVEQGIIDEKGIRRSKDEEIIAILCSCLLSDNTSGMSVDALDRLYNAKSQIYEKNESVLTSDRICDIIDLFRQIVSDLEKTFSLKNTTFDNLLFSGKKKYNKDLVFIIVFLSIAKLYMNNYQISDYSRMADILENITDTDLSAITQKSECKWNVEVRNHFVENVSNNLRKCMKYREHDLGWNREFLSMIRHAVAEKQMYDFKIGLHDLRNGNENKNMIPKCIKTLTAMANTNPGKEGIIFIGISDKDSDAEDFRNHYHSDPIKYNDFYVPGINNEAAKYYGGIPALMDSIKQSIEREKDKVSSDVIHKILTTIDTLQYEDQTVIVLRLATDKPLFYDKKMYVRYSSNNKEIVTGSDLFYEVLNKFNTVNNSANDTDSYVQKVTLF